MNEIEQKSAQELFTHRCDEKFISKYCYLANFLDPRYKGHSFVKNSAKLTKVLETLKEYGTTLDVTLYEKDYEDVSRCLRWFRNNQQLFKCQLLDTSVPDLYWSNLDCYDDYRKLALIASRILKVPASSAAVERSFSFQKRLQTKDRNRFKSGRIEKIMKIQWALKNETKMMKNRNLLTEKAGNGNPTIDFSNSSGESETDESDSDDNESDEDDCSQEQIQENESEQICIIANNNMELDMDDLMMNTAEYGS